jgi:tight adherence protein B
MVAERIRSTDASRFPPGSVRPGAAVVCAAAAGALVLAGPGLACVVVIVAACGAAVVSGHWRHGEQARYEAGLIEPLQVMARSLRGGGSFLAALGDAAASATEGPVAGDLGRLHQALARGDSVAAALQRWAATRDQAAVRLVAAALTLGHENGTLSARAVDGLAAGVQLGVDARSEVAALASQAQVSAAVMVAAPLGFFALLAAADRGMWRTMTTTTPGLACLLGGLLLDVGAGFAMARIVRSVR